MLFHKILLVSVFGLMVASDVRPKPQVLLSVYPRFATTDPNGIEVTAMLIIKNIDEELWCPEIEWEWNGQRSSQLSDCTPYQDSEEGERAFWSESQQRRFYGPGTVRVQVKLRKEGKVLRRLDASMAIK